MKHLFAFLFLITVFTTVRAQYYFPPILGQQWDTASATSLGWCASEWDTLSDYVESRNSKSFIILHKGKMIYESYYNGHGRDSAWYWASAGKSLVAFLVGMAQEQSLLDINDKTSQYLGNGWTITPQAKEELITIKEQLKMTTGLDFNVSNQNCLEDTCLKYLHDAGTHWYYHNAPYRLLQEVIEAASNKTINAFTFQSLAASTGINGLWLDHIFFSKARNMARFGLLNLNNGSWNGNTILGDTAYFNAMSRPSQNLNPAYGYLWWLNGGSFYKQPGFDITFNGAIIPNAPADLYMAAGANDQRIYIVPSLDLVVVRQGNAAYSQQLALSQFDNELWGLIMNLICQPVSLEEIGEEVPSIYPNPTADILQFNQALSGEVRIFNTQGQLMYETLLDDAYQLNVEQLKSGHYLLMHADVTHRFYKK